MSREAADTAPDPGAASAAAASPNAQIEADTSEGEEAADPEVELLITAEAAYPAFERVVLAARKRINMSFRIFDLRTRLRSAEAQRIGTTWADILADALRRGVDVRLVISDFDPVGAPELHRGTWRTLRQCAGLWELADRPSSGALTVIPARHPARIGAVPGLLFWPVAASKLRAAIAMLNDLTPEARGRFLTEAPHLRPHLCERIDPLASVQARWSKGFALTPVTHHQKLAVIDGEVLYIGGLDLDERRYDTPHHDQPARQTWHDTQMILRVPALAAQAERHLNSFTRQTAGAGPPAEGQGSSAAAAPGLRFLTTLSAAPRAAPFRFSPHSRSTGLYQAHAAQVELAEQLIYLESQYFRDRRLTRALLRRKQENPDLSLFLVLPAAPEEVAFSSGGADSRFGEFLQTRCLRKLRRAFGERFFVASPAQRRRPGAPESEAGKEALWTADGAGRERGGIGRAALHGAPLIYVHAKVSVFDERAAIVSSANLNGRSLWWDTEAGVEVTRGDSVAMIRRRVLGHWYPDVDGAQRSEMLDLGTAFEAWVSAARRDAKRPPEARQGYLLPYDIRPARRFGISMPAVPEEMV